MCCANQLDTPAFGTFVSDRLYGDNASDKAASGLIWSAVELALFSAPLTVVTMRLCFHRRLETFWSLIEKEYRSPELNLEAAARECGVGKNHLNSMLRRTVGLTFRQFLIRYRLLRAIAAMCERDFSLKEIACQVGFGSLSSFEKNFRKIFGFPPRDFPRRSGIFAT